MIDAIAGDIIGSAYEFEAIKTTDFPSSARGPLTGSVPAG